MNEPHALAQFGELNWNNWPANEQYIDFAIYPLHNENCFNQTTVPAACYWFYMANRP